MLEIAGSVITIDAMGCQKDITSLIINQKGDYILAWKGNQKLLYKAVKLGFEVAQKADYLSREYNYYEQVEAYYRFPGYYPRGNASYWTLFISGEYILI